MEVSYEDIRKNEEILAFIHKGNCVSNCSSQ